MNNVVQSIQFLKPFVKQVTGKKAEKAIVDMARMLNAALSEAEIEPSTYIDDYKKDIIFNPVCLLENHPDIFEFVVEKYRPLAKILFEMRPVGLGTPNAMVGEGEFMCLLFSPRVGISKEKNKGDLTVDGKTIELKGDLLRFFSPMKTTGKQVQTHAAKISEKYNIKPNLCKGNRMAYEPWDHGNNKKLNKKDHWINEFSKIGQNNAQKYLNELCSCFMECKEKDFDTCFSKGTFDVKSLQKLMVKKFFKGMDKKWDAFTQINEGRIISITDDPKKFDELVDTDILKMDDPYFRSFQDTVVGMYVKLS